VGRAERAADCDDRVQLLLREPVEEAAVVWRDSSFEPAAGDALLGEP
jgi:hypothetical protein